MSIRLFDAFSGVGGFRIGFEREGFEVVGWSEIDKNAIKLYSEYFGDNRNYGDITKINPEELPDFEVITAGVPCQPFSIAGKRRGLKDERGLPLWEALFRIIEAKRPRVVLIENVRGLLSSNGGRDFAWVLVRMARLGYTVEWQVLNSKDFGVPQNRERVYIIGYFGGDGRPKIFPLRDNEKAPYRVHRKNDNNTITPKTPVKIPFRRGRINVVCNVYPSKGSAGRVVLDRGISPAITSGDSSRAIIILRTVGEDNGYAIVDFDNIVVRRITPLEAFRLQGFPDDIVKIAKEIGLSDSSLYRLAGNSVTIPVVQTIARKIRKVFF